jgi:uncharacterized protein YjbJ (UPF0337 family)
MNPDILKGRWLQVKGDVRRRWGKLTDNDVTEIEGRVEILVGKLQERYGLKREEAEKQINEFLTPSGIRKTA